MMVRWLSILLGCLFLTGCYGHGEPEPVFVGHIAPFSGRDKAIGDHAKQAIQLAAEEINKNEGQNGGRRLLVLHVDSHGDLESLQPEAVRLIRVNKVMTLLGGENAEGAERLGRACQPYEVAVVTPAPLAAAPKGDNVFSINGNQRFRGEVIARFAREELKANRAAILIDGRRAGNAELANAAQKELAAGNGLTELWQYKSDAEFKELTDRVLKGQFQEVLLAGPVADLGALRTKLASSAAKLPLLYGGGEFPIDQANGQMLDGVYYVTAFAGDGDTPQGRAFVNTYQERFHEAPDADAALAFDGIRLLAEAFAHAKIKNPASVRAVLAEAGFTFDGLTGPLTFASDFSARRPLFIGQIRAGKPVAVKRYEPEAP
jgi:branched-chain amino acid transport system substrate-binding protein